MISAISSANSAMTRPQQSALTTDQSKKLTEVLSNYDAKNVTEADAKAIAAQVKDLGIQPGKAMAEAMKTQGFDAKSIGDMARPDQAGGKGGPEGARPPPPPKGEGMAAKGTVDSTAVSLLAEVLDSYADTEMTEDTWAEAMATLSEKRVDLTKSMVDIRL